MGNPELVLSSLKVFKNLWEELERVCWLGGLPGDHRLSSAPFSPASSSPEVSYL